jgi:hypothetical protein
MPPPDPSDRAAPLRVDLHAHYVGRELIDAATAHPERYGLRIEVDASGERVRFPDGALVRPFFPELWDLEARLATMDASGVAVEVLSTWTDIFGDGLLGEREAAWAALQNDTLAAAAGRDRSLRSARTASGGDRYQHRRTEPGRAALRADLGPPGGG